MTAHDLAFGRLLRRWREQRRMTQMDLAHTAESSTRHISCLETGKARPSCEMVLHLAEVLDIPLRDRNSLLLAAGFAPAFQERSLSELTAARQAFERVLRAHEPYPAFVVDGHWNIVLSNNALPQIYLGCAAELLRPPMNAVRLMLHPRGLAPRIVNLAEWRGHVFTVLRHQFEARADAGIQALLSEVMSYAPPVAHSARMPSESHERYAMPLQIATDAGIICLFSTTTIFGTPNDVALSELALEMLFPADDQTEAIVKTLMTERFRGADHQELLETG